MSTADRPKPDERVRHVDVGDKYITFHLYDGRIVSVPLSWSPRLEAATLEERQNFLIGGSAHGVHWPDVDEDLSGEGALRGMPAPRLSFLPPSKDWTRNEVRRLRLRMGKTISAFSAVMGVRRATVSDWEHGKKSISPMGQKLLDRLVERFETGKL